MIQRMDNVLIVVEDLEAAKAFFAELDMELEARRRSRGLGWTRPWGSTASVPTSP
jgi:catechol 2,3-dioxygenase-like lactoylglutathione lyase family enzyme